MSNVVLRVSREATHSQAVILMEVKSDLRSRVEVTCDLRPLPGACLGQELSISVMNIMRLCVCACVMCSVELVTVILTDCHSNLEYEVTGYLLILSVIFINNSSLV